MAHPLRRAVTLLRAPGNSLGFAVRRALRWSRGLPELPHEDQDQGELSAAAAQLAERYDLAPLAARSSRWVYRGNLAVLEGLERLLAGRDLPASRGPLQAIDVGSGDWHYAFALHRFLSRHASAIPRRIRLLGIEVDGHGIYRNLHSRADHARAFAAQIGEPDVEYRVADFCTAPLPTADVVTLMFPFLTAYALLSWGLPLGLHRPRTLLRRAIGVLRPGGYLVVFNQTTTERGRLLLAVRDLPVEVLHSAPLRTDLLDDGARTADRVGTLLQRTTSLC